ARGLTRGPYSGPAEAADDPTRPPLGEAHRGRALPAFRLPGGGCACCSRRERVTTHEAGLPLMETGRRRVTPRPARAAAAGRRTRGGSEHALHVLDAVDEAAVQAVRLVALDGGHAAEQLPEHHGDLAPGQ